MSERNLVWTLGFVMGIAVGFAVSGFGGGRAGPASVNPGPVPPTPDHVPDEWVRQHAGTNP